MVTNDMTTDTPSVGPSPADLAAVRHAHAASPPEPARGQIWRASWQSTAQLVLVLRVGGGAVSAAPVAPDTELGDDCAVIVDADTSPFDYSVVVWAGLTAELPVQVLAVYLGQVDDAVLAPVRAHRGAGAPITHLLDERVQVRDVIADRMDALAKATPSTPPVEKLHYRQTSA